jgi:hypothetical protein
MSFERRTFRLMTSPRRDGRRLLTKQNARSVRVHERAFVNGQFRSADGGADLLEQLAR